MTVSSLIYLSAGFECCVCVCVCGLFALCEKTKQWFFLFASSKGKLLSLFGDLPPKHTHTITLQCTYIPASFVSFHTFSSTNKHFFSDVISTTKASSSPSFHLNICPFYFASGPTWDFLPPDDSNWSCRVNGASVVAFCVCVCVCMCVCVWVCVFVSGKTERCKPWDLCLGCSKSQR